MALTRRQERILEQIINLVETIRAEEDRINPGRAKRIDRGRRSKAETETMRQDILIARAKGVRAVDLAEKYGVTVPYIYMINKK